MWTFSDLIKNFFLHKDFLPQKENIPGTMFTPLHFIFAACVAALLIFLGLRIAKKSERTIRITFTCIWAVLVVWEVVKIWWETCYGKTVDFEWGGILPLYPCSIFMYAMPFAIWGQGLVRRAACGYVCSLGLLGAAINFVYPATILGNYSCISFAGFHTFFYHGMMLLCALVMLRSGYHSYRNVTKWYELLLPATPFLAVSILANAVNFSHIYSDYMFFRLDSFIFAPIGQATADWLAVIIVYFAYLLIHALPYLPSFLANRKNTAAA